MLCRRFYATSLFLAISLACHAQTYIFGKADMPVGNTPAAIVTGDFNRDGVPDLAVANSTDNTISILLGQPNGAFAAQVTYPTGPVPISMVTADFNGDGNLDLAVSNLNCSPSPQGNPPQCSPSTVSVFLGNGDGTFQPQATYSVGTLPASMVTADFNGDGKPDLAVVNGVDGTISILLGNGDGTFQGQVTYPAPLQVDSLSLPSLVLGDFNGDGILDLAAAGGDSVLVLLSNGNGTFQAPLQTTITNLTGGYLYGLAVGDFNGDGKLDLVLANGTTTDVFLGNGNGTFYLNTTYSNDNAGEIVAADLNGDGKLDLVMTQGASVYQNLGGSFAVALGNGDGTFGNPTFYGTGALPLAVILSDFNGDGKLDVAVTNAVSTPPVTKASFAGSVSILLGFGDGTFVSTTDYTLPYLPSSVLSADFTRNGDLDLAVGLESSVGVFRGNGNGTFQPYTSFATADSPYPQLAAGDLRNDGIVDLVTANNPCSSGSSCTPGTISVLLGNGNGTFQTHVDYAAGLQPEGIALGSFRNNGTLDVAVANYGANTVSILLDNGDGTFQPQVVYSTPPYPQQIAVGDFNKDGNLDLAVATLNNGAAILLGNGDGTFQSAISYGPGAVDVLTADFNGDGALDLVLASSNGGVVILLGNGDGTFQPASNLLPFQATSLAVGDMNGDGKLDLAVNWYLANNLLIALGNGDGTFQLPKSYGAIPGNAQSLTLGDFNGDGVPDWVASFGDMIHSGGLAVMLSTPFKSISPGALNFGSEGVGTTSPAQTVTLSNPSNVQFSITNIVASGPFAQTNTCGASLGAGATCTITVSFSPAGTGQQSGAITITDSTRISPVAVPLSGNGVTGSYLMAYPAHQNFSPQLVGSASTSAAIQLVNTGSAALGMSGISITGTDNSDFAQTNNCGSSLAAGGSCTANVTFTPQASGSRTAVLSISDSATGSPQTVSLTGFANTPPNFSISPSSGSPTSATIAAGQTATFNLAFAPMGAFTGTVNLNCAITPAATPAATCSLSSSSVQIGGTGTQSVTVSVGTTAPVTSGAVFHSGFPPAAFPLVWTVTLLGLATGLVKSRKWRLGFAAAPVMLLIAFSMSCGGSGSGGSGGGTSGHTSPGTPAGTYSATVTAASGSVSHTMTLQVTVQ
jgi:hypothetical protein